MTRVLMTLCVLAGLSACTPTQMASYPENTTTAACFTGTHAFDMEISVPQDYGRVLALTQHARDAGGLRPVCRLVTDAGTLGRGSYPVYTGEIDNGRDDLCVSARTTNGGHVLSCAPASQVRAAMVAPQGSAANRIRLTRWSPFPGSS